MINHAHKYKYFHSLSHNTNCYIHMKLTYILTSHIKRHLSPIYKQQEEQEIKESK